MINIIIGSDHGGFKLKEYLNDNLDSEYNVIDKGCYSEESIDYPDIAKKVCNELLDFMELSDKLDSNKLNSNKYYDNKHYGILVCGTGQGMNITANKFDKIRCALCHNEYTAIMSRQHNNANIISIGQRLFEEKDYKQVLNIVEKFINTEFEGGRHKLHNFIC